MKKVKGWVAMLWTGHNDYLDKECERQGAFGISLRFRIILVGLLTKLRTFCNSWRGAIVF